MDVFLGLVGILGWILAVIVLAMAVTWVVVKVSPTGDPKRPKGNQAAEGR
jgi:hypothetical protein